MERLKLAAAVVWLASGVFVALLGWLAYSQIGGMIDRISAIETVLLCPVERIKFSDGQCASLAQILDAAFPKQSAPSP